MAFTTKSSLSELFLLFADIGSLIAEGALHFSVGYIELLLLKPYPTLEEHIQLGTIADDLLVHIH